MATVKRGQGGRRKRARRMAQVEHLRDSFRRRLRKAVLRAICSTPKVPMLDDLTVLRLYRYGLGVTVHYPLSIVYGDEI